MKINRILENRLFSGKGGPYEIFEKKVIDALYLERKIMMMKFGKREQYQSRIQYIVFLVSCLEYFLEEVFKKSIDNKIINIDGVKKDKNLSSLKLNLQELQEINKNKIKISEIIAEEINFQNINDIILFCDLLKLSKKFRKVFSRKKIELPDFKGVIPHPSKMKLPTIEKKMTKFILKGFFQSSFTLPKNPQDLIKMINTIQKMIFLRHKIVHKAHLVKINNWESLAYTMATVQLAFFVNECYKIELKNKKSKQNDTTKN